MGGGAEIMNYTNPYFIRFSLGGIDVTSKTAIYGRQGNITNTTNTREEGEAGGQARRAAAPLSSGRR